MTTTELYINNKRCDIARDFSVRLNRQLVKPGELHSKDAQYSYSINLPATEKNHCIFNYSNIEETRDKFNRKYEAELIVNGLMVFRGRFRLSEIRRDRYRGNLYIPAPKSVKDIFGNTKLGENPEYLLDFSVFSDSVNKYNLAAKTEPQEAIFPYALYGVLPKKASSTGTYSHKNTWDDTVRIGMQDMPPSINPLKLIKHIFNSRGYKIDGSAFDNEALKNLYMSYKNDPKYVQPWNYSQMAEMHLTGIWASTHNKNTNAEGRQLELGVTVGAAPIHAHACNLLNATNTKINIGLDRGNNITSSTKKVKDDPYGRSFNIHDVRIPTAGFYKVRLSMGVKLFDTKNYEGKDPSTGVTHISCYSDITSNGMDQWGNIGEHPGRMYEVRLLRDWGEGDFGLSDPNLDGTFYRDNLDQTIQSEDEEPQYFPYNRPQGQQHFIDAAQDRNIVCGFAFGKPNYKEYKNPQEQEGRLTQIQIAKPAKSWDSDVKGYTRLAVDNPSGYRKRIKNGPFEPEIWEDTDMFKINFHTPFEEKNFASRDTYFEETNLDKWMVGTGRVSLVVWLEAGERLTLASVSERGRYREYNQSSVLGWTEHEVRFKLDIEPFQKDPSWLKLDESGKSTGEMSWYDPVSFGPKGLDLVGFLPQDMKTDDFLAEFCKAFNLRLSPVDEKSFSLDLKQTKAALGSSYINLDTIAAVKDRSNTPLGLPERYKLGFTVDVEEEGYVLSGDDGGGEFSTGAIDGGAIDQKSAFSYNWFKQIVKKEGDADIQLTLPVLSKHNIWTSEFDYFSAMLKRNTNLATRFWFFDGLLNDLGASFEFGSHNEPLYIAKVSNRLPGECTLSYKNEKKSILDNFFTILSDGGSHYTEIEGYLTPDQYEQLNGSILAKFNGDLYYVAELSGYDPEVRNKTKIKLIRKI